MILNWSGSFRIGGIGKTTTSDMRVSLLSTNGMVTPGGVGLRGKTDIGKTALKLLPAASKNLQYLLSPPIKSSTAGIPVPCPDSLKSLNV